MFPTAPTGRSAIPGAVPGRARKRFPGYLRHARALLAGLPGQLDDAPTGLSPEFEALRWFPLPPGCLTPDSLPPAQEATPAG